jgi:hypothetical protein
MADDEVRHKTVFAQVEHRPGGGLAARRPHVVARAEPMRLPGAARIEAIS